VKRFLCAVLVFLLALGAVPAMAEAAAIRCKVVRINEYGHAKLDITEADFRKAGFELGDIVTVTGGSYTGVMPVFNGYYADRSGLFLPGRTGTALPGALPGRQGSYRVRDHDA